MKKIFLFFFTISILTFSSCTIGGTYYLINETGEDLVIRFEFENNKNNFARKISKIKTKKYNGRKIKHRKIDKMTEVETNYDASDNSIEFKLGRNEYAYLGFGRNYYNYFIFYGVKKLIAKGENTMIELDKNQTHDKVNIKTQRGGFLHYVRIYTLIND